MARGESISAVLSRIDGRGYGAYRELKGARERVDGIEVTVVRVQADPYAPPSVVKLEARHDLRRLRDYPIPVADYVYRRLYRALRKRSRRLGEGRSGFLGLPKPSNAILRRSGVEVRGSRVIARVWVGLPSRRRRVLASVAEKLILQDLVNAFRKAVSGLNDSNPELQRHVDAWIEQEYVRKLLPELDAVAFVADGSLLPRRCGGCEDPLPGAKPFRSPPSLRVELDLPTGRRAAGMVVRRGVTVVAGSAFHGKTTLAEAIALGIYNHVPGDGRELVVSLRSTVVVRAEDGRTVSCVDVSTFIHDLPGRVDVECFTTRDASGATSTAAAVQEAVELGAELLIVDEDYVASNMLYTDPVATKLTRRASVSPLAVKALSMRRHGISMIVVTQGHEPLLAVANTVIVMEDYEPRNVTAEAKMLAKTVVEEEYTPPKPRRLAGCTQLARPRLRGFMLESKTLPHYVNVWNPQLVEEAQYRTLLTLLRRLEGFEGLSCREIAERVESLLDEGFGAVYGSEPGPDMAEVRGFDFLYMVNRLPVCRFTH